MTTINDERQRKLIQWGFLSAAMQRVTQEIAQEEARRANALANLTAVWNTIPEETITRLRKISENYGETPASVVWDVVRTGDFDYDEDGRVVVLEAVVIDSASDAVDKLGLEL